MLIVNDREGIARCLMRMIATDGAKPMMDGNSILGIKTNSKQLEALALRPAAREARNTVAEAAGKCRAVGQDTTAKELDAMATKLDQVISQEDSVAARSWRCRIGWHAPGRWRGDTVIARGDSVASALEEYRWRVLHLRVCTRCGLTETRETPLLSKARVICTNVK